MQNRNTLIIVVIVLILVVGGGYLYTQRPSSTTPDTGSSTTTASLVTSTSTNIVSVTSSNTSVKGIQTTSGSAGYSVNIIPDKTAAKAPDYTKPIAYSASISPTLKSALQAQFNITVAAINKDKYNFNAWIDLGAQHHMAGDDTAAAAIWEYASLTWPTNVASFNNLGDLYANFLKNYAKAETNFLTAIKNKPSDTNPYRNLFTLYYTAGYNKAKAEAILKQGIAAAPKAVDMQVLLARYYRDTGRTAEAKAEYNLAITNAQSQSQTSLATTIQSERDAF